MCFRKFLLCDKDVQWTTQDNQNMKPLGCNTIFSVFSVQKLIIAQYWEEIWVHNLQPYVLLSDKRQPCLSLTIMPHSSWNNWHTTGDTTLCGPIKLMPVTSLVHTEATGPLIQRMDTRFTCAISIEGWLWKGMCDFIYIFQFCSKFDFVKCNFLLQCCLCDW